MTDPWSALEQRVTPERARLAARGGDGGGGRSGRRCAAASRWRAARSVARRSTRTPTPTTCTRRRSTTPPARSCSSRSATGCDAELADLYRFGDAAERRGLLRALPYLPVGDGAMEIVDDAIRTNDTRLVAAALGPYATEHLDDAAYDQAVLKCVFIGVPIAPLDGLPRRATAETARMLAAFVHERVAAGRDIPAEVWDVIDRHPPAEELAAIEAERSSEFADRREAAERALAHHQGGVS